MKNLLVIVGPTGVGKTKLSIELAKKINGEIISADSMQIYKNMDIGTAKITKDEMNNVNHHMIDIINPDTEFSVSEYRDLTKKHIEDIINRGKTPILVGGTGLYINSIVYNLDFTEIPSDIKIRNKYQNYCDKYGNKALYKLLLERDEDSALKLHPNDTKRIIRALEVYEISGRKMSYYNKNFREENKDYNIYMIGLYTNREELYKIINNRVDRMLEENLVKEVTNLYKEYGKDLTSMKAIGYKEVIQYLEGAYTYEDMIQFLKRNSRRYAKRQLTWFKRDHRINWFDLYNLNTIEEIYTEVNKVFI